MVCSYGHNIAVGIYLLVVSLIISCIRYVGESIEMLPGGRPPEPASPRDKWAHTYTKKQGIWARSAGGYGISLGNTTIKVTIFISIPIKIS